MTSAPPGWKARRYDSAIEPLESRIAPATLVNATTVTYHDIDGDDVTLKLKNPVFDIATINNVLVFDAGGTDANPANDTPQQLRLIDFTALANPANAAGTDIKLTAKRNGTNGGDGSANLGYINSTGRDLGTVMIAGDLGRVDAGDNDIPNVSIKSLSVQSMGRFGTSTQVPAGATLLSTLKGAVNSLTIRGDFVEAHLVSDSSITTLKVGGSIIGGAATDSGEIECSALGKATISGSIIGGGGTGSGRLDAVLGIGAVTIGGGILGGDGPRSGRLETTAINLGGNLGPVTINGDIRGGGGDESGVVASQRDLVGITVGGSLVAGTGSYEVSAQEGQIFAKRDMGPVKIAHEVIGGPKNESGAIVAFGNIASVTIGGPVLGGTGDASAFIGSTGDTIGPVKITGDVIGNGPNSANISCDGAIVSVTIGGSVIGSGDQSAVIEAFGLLGPVKITRDLIGGAANSGKIEGNAGVISVTIGGSVIGGAGDTSGAISSADKMGKVKITGNVRGGGGPESGSIQSFASLAGVEIGGSVSSGAGALSGAIMSDDDILALKIKGSVFGSAAVPVVISGAESSKPTATTDVALPKIDIKGGTEFALIRAGYDTDGNAVNADAQIGVVSVAGDWIASSVVAGVVPSNTFFGDADDAKIGVGDTGGIVSKISSITIKGQALGTVGGVDHFGFVAQQIVLLKVGPVTLPLVAGEASVADIAGYAVGATGDLRVREVAI